MSPLERFCIYVDPETHPHAEASFAKFSLGVGGARGPLLPGGRYDHAYLKLQGAILHELLPLCHDFALQ